MLVPAEIQTFFESEFGEILSYLPCSGGCINNGGRVKTKSGDFFVKWNSSTKFPGMFSLEKQGLELLLKTQTLQIPNVLAVFEGQEHGCLVMDFISSGLKSSTYSEKLGHGLAELHQTTLSSFGLDHDNYIGSLPQSNRQYMSWIDFFVNERVQPQVDMAVTNGSMGVHKADQIESFCKSLDTFFPATQPSLIHGDLWGGNVMVNQHGNPVLIDPSVAFSHPEVDIAMTKLFGGFDSNFYDAYNETSPLEPGWQERLDIYNLYPLLVHVNLFGGGYLNQVMQIIDRYK